MTVISLSVSLAATLALIYFVKSWRANRKERPDVD